MLIAALFTIAKIWKQPKCPSIDEWIKELWDTHTHTHMSHTYIHNGILLGHKKNEILPFATAWMDLEGIMLSKISQTEKDKYHKWTNKWTNRNRCIEQRTDTWLPEGKGGCVKQVEGLRSTNWQLQNSHGDVKYRLGFIINNTVITVWCQVGDGNTGGTTL